jgi:signal transduction histidine kinase
MSTETRSRSGWDNGPCGGLNSSLAMENVNDLIQEVCTCVQSVPYVVQPVTSGSDVDTNADEWGFVAPAVHQLRTPLTSILSFSDLLISGIGSESDREEWTGHIRGQAMRMKSSLNSFLSVSEIETGQLVLRPTSVDLESVCNELIKVTAAVAPDVRLQSNIAPNARWIRADEPRFQEIMWNLVDNAVKYSAGGGVVTITSATDELGMVQIEVSDSGAGIPEDRLGDLFQPFRRAVGERAAKGTGLGLYIVKALAEMHLGHVGVTSEPGEGTTFTVTLPSVDSEGQQPGFQYVDARPASNGQQAPQDVQEANTSPTPGVSEANSEQGDFMRWISYELRAPLTPLLAAAELLAEPTAPMVRRDQWLRRIRALAVRMKCVTDATMTASHLRSGRVSIETRPFDVISVFASVIGQTAPLVEGRRVSMNVDDDARDVVGDQQRLVDVLSALVESAVRECSDDSEIILNAHRVPDTDGVAACVSFTAQKTAPTLDDKGPTSGLGLRVAAQLAQLQGGSVEICVTPSGQTSYRATLASA